MWVMVSSGYGPMTVQASNGYKALYQLGDGMYITTCFNLVPVTHPCNWIPSSTHGHDIKCKRNCHSHEFKHRQWMDVPVYRREAAMVWSWCTRTQWEYNALWWSIQDSATSTSGARGRVHLRHGHNLPQIVSFFSCTGVLAAIRSMRNGVPHSLQERSSRLIRSFSVMTEANELLVFGFWLVSCWSFKD